MLVSTTLIFVWLKAVCSIVQYVYFCLNPNGYNIISCRRIDCNLRYYICSLLLYIITVHECYILSQELDAVKQDKLYLEHSKENNNDLLNYLRSLEPAIVSF